MKLATETSPTIALDTMKVSQMGIDANSSDLIQYFLRDKIYTNKILAVVREYICNAIDEHRKYKIDKPVQVWIDSTNEFHGTTSYTWNVRDYAKGLSDHDIRNVFGVYGNSTKRNDNIQIGSFGLGSKAFHCYTDTFYIDSFYGGKKTTYACVLGGGKNGVPVGEIYEIAQEPSDQTGLWIHAEIKKNNMEQFRNTTMEFVLAFDHNDRLEFNDRVCGDTYNPRVPTNTLKCGDLVIHNYNIDGDNTYTHNNHVYIRMGGVIYGNRSFMGCLSHRTIIDVPMGSLTLPVSRESIENTGPNIKLFDEIDKVILKINDDTVASFPPVTLSDILSNENLFSSHIQTTWFKYRPTDIYAAQYNVYRRLMVVDACKSIVPKNDKIQIYIIPNSCKRKEWLIRLKNYLASLAEPIDNFAYTIHDYAVHMAFEKCVSFSGEYELIDVRNMKLPTLHKQPAKKKDSYVVYDDGIKIGEFTPNGLNDYAENIIPASEWPQNAKNTKELYSRVIVNRSNYRGFSYLSAGSDKFVGQMLALGWKIPSDPAIVVKLQEFREQNEKKIAIRNIKNIIHCNYFKVDVSEHVKQAMIRNPKRYGAKMKMVRDKILSESTLRSKILNQFGRYNYDADVLTHEERRIIMKLK